MVLRFNGQGCCRIADRYQIGQSFAYSCGFLVSASSPTTSGIVKLTRGQGNHTTESRWYFPPKASNGLKVRDKLVHDSTFYCQDNDIHLANFILFATDPMKLWNAYSFQRGVRLDPLE